jgi:rhamnopyranosyl-N-acetylglucosaminyl-diphospho-decaprenol beta-1,3/1,4-galactofuranosyltransferase
MKTALAVVVTYNRLDCLKPCVEALLNQTCQDFDILIVNNGSTDGTKEWVNSLPTQIFRIHQENLGGAGGFYQGQKYSFDNGYEWVWMMDDDGIPERTQFENLISVATTYNKKIVGPIVMNIEKSDELAFSPGEIFTKPLVNLPYSDTYQLVSPFNGVMFHRSVIENIGFIKKEMFIWGDEREYRLRCHKHGYFEVAALNAIHYHPMIKGKRDNALPFTDKFKVIIKPEKFAKYFYRNNGFINKTYSSTKVVIGEFLIYTIYFLRKLKFSELYKFWNYYSKGCRNQF